MRFSLRARLFTTSILLFSVAGLSAGLYLQSAIGSALQERMERELALHAKSFRATLNIVPRPDADALAKSMAKGAPFRLTLIATDGRVIADSAVKKERQGLLDNHGHRPEVIAARATGLGVSQRFSTTLQVPMLYVALPLDDKPTNSAIVRASMPMRTIHTLVRQLRWALLAAGAIAFVLTLVMTGLASRWMTQSLQPLLERARAAGESGSEVADGPLSELEGSFHRLSRDLDRAVAKLARERDRLWAVLEGMDDAVIALKANGRIKLANRAATELIAASQPLQGEQLALRGQQLEAVLPHPQLNALALNPLGGTLEMHVEQPVGRELLVRVTPLKTAPGGSVLVFLDVTETKRIDRIRRDFIANVSHELRTPVAVMLNNAEALCDGALEDPVRARKMAAALERNATRLSHLIADLLDLARIESGRFVPVKQNVLLLDAIGAALDVVQNRAANRVQLDVPEHLSAYCDRQALEQILMNYLDNAAKYTSPDAPIVVRAALIDDGGQVRIDVCDHGPGIAPMHRPRLFERFYRVDAGRSKEVGGTGLGLAIVKHLASAMEGQVGMRPADDGGAIFYVVLPTGEPAA